jgi:EmrB/QacA subfamily drug resistance transporter
MKGILNMSKKLGSKNHFGFIVAVYLLGIFMGAIDTGIVTPARTIIQNDLGVGSNTGIWMITIYTLAYAASIPIMGKLADKYGRKYVYLISILMFGVGSLFCGLSQVFGSFSILLCARVVQAIGGGGIVPIATAEFGTTFPKEKRGMALGLIGGVYGIANIFGSSAGSAILDLFGSANWKYIFFINVPITVFILIVGYLFLPNSKSSVVKKIDLLGISVLTVMVLSILYGLKNIDYFNFKDSFISTSVYPFVLLFFLLMPLFILAEKKAADPVLNLAYFKSLRINITLFISFITGVVIMGIIFVPQLCENIMKIASGDGGYFVIILGLFAGIGAPISGKLIDRFGPKLVLAIGFISSICGALFFNYVAMEHPNMFTVAVGLILIGIGVGFTMGTPVNYMMLENTKSEEANSALAAVSLVRSIGTAIAPAFLVGFISHAGMNISGNIMEVLPAEIHMPKIQYAEELSNQINYIKSNEKAMAMLGDVNLDAMDIGAMTDMKFDMSKGSNIQFPDELITKMQAADVTTITDSAKLMASYMFTTMGEKAVDGISQGIAGMETQNPMMVGTMLTYMKSIRDDLPGAFAQAEADYMQQVDASSTSLQTIYQDTLNQGFRQIYLTVAIVSLLALLVLIGYRPVVKTKDEKLSEIQEDENKEDVWKDQPASAE